MYMKTLTCFWLAAALAVTTYSRVDADTPSPLAAPAPTAVPAPGGTSLDETVGLTLYNNVVYLVRDNGATRLDTTTIPAGHMMTLDGRIVPLPPAVQFPKATAPQGGAAPPNAAVQRNSGAAQPFIK